jgi:hypothetical protein
MPHSHTHTNDLGRKLSTSAISLFPNTRWNRNNSMKAGKKHHICQSHVYTLPINLIIDILQAEILSLILHTVLQQCNRGTTTYRSALRDTDLVGTGLAVLQTKTSIAAARCSVGHNAWFIPTYA